MHEAGQRLRLQFRSAGAATVIVFHKYIHMCNALDIVN